MYAKITVLILITLLTRALSHDDHQKPSSKVPKHPLNLPPNTEVMNDTIPSPREIRDSTSNDKEFDPFARLEGYLTRREEEIKRKNEEERKSLQEEWNTLSKKTETDLSKWIEDESKTIRGVLHLVKLYEAIERLSRIPQKELLEKKFPEIAILDEPTVENKELRSQKILKYLNVLNEDQMSFWISEVKKIPLLGMEFIMSLNPDIPGPKAIQLDEDGYVMPDENDSNKSDIRIMTVQEEYSKAKKLLFVDVVDYFYSSADLINRVWQHAKNIRNSKVVRTWAERLGRYQMGITWLERREKNGTLHPDSSKLKINRSNLLHVQNYSILYQEGYVILLKPKKTSSFFFVPVEVPAVGRQGIVLPQYKPSNTVASNPFQSSPSTQNDPAFQAALERSKQDETPTQREKRELDEAIKRSLEDASQQSVQQVPEYKDGDNDGAAFILIGKYSKQIPRDQYINNFPPFEKIWALIPIEERNFTKNTAQAQYNIMFYGQPTF